MYHNTALIYFLLLLWLYEELPTLNEKVRTKKKELCYQLKIAYGTALAAFI